MRLLALHGKGTSAKIFQSQCSSFRNLLDPNEFEFDFIDAPFPANPAPGIDLFYPPPYYSFYDPTVESIKAAHTWLLAYLDRHGPYDGVINFSQGCALSSTLLLYHQKFYPHKEPLFKVAMFICGGVPLNMLDDLGIPVSEEARDWDESSRNALFAKASSDAILREGSKRWGHGFDAVALQDTSNMFGINFDEIPKESLIQIPTVHVYGAKDPRYPASLQLAHFCDSSKRRMYDHGGGHDIPRMQAVSEMMAELVRWCSMIADSW
ncbi:putative EF-hand calcium-binding domain protein [Bisporella sp. PMI_857]|nr:putative EF-hand calcium-binding domain protein [Bisporella sp. PMI_857]